MTQQQAERKATRIISNQHKACIKELGDRYTVEAKIQFNVRYLASHLLKAYKLGINETQKVS